MYDRIVLALDGSALAERALPHSKNLAKAFGAKVIVLRAVPPVVQPLEMGDAVSAAFTYQQLLDAELQEARAYCDRRVVDLQDEGIAALALVQIGEPASTILEAAAAQNADLIVMTTHGRSGFGKWVYGSVAERVLQRAPVPLLLVRASDHR